MLTFVFILPKCKVDSLSQLMGGWRQGFGVTHITHLREIQFSLLDFEDILCFVPD